MFEPCRRYVQQDRDGETTCYEGAPADGDSYGDAKDILFAHDVLLRQQVYQIDTKSEDPWERNDQARFFGAVLENKDKLEHLVPMQIFL